MHVNAQATALSGTTDGRHVEDLQDAATLRLLGATQSGDALLCSVEPSPGADTAARCFVLPVDDRLRAAVHGERRGVDANLAGHAARTTEWEKPMTPQLRPKEIQDRIRAGANVEQVAAAAGCTVDRIEGFAYPVLLERATIAEKARAARPLHGAMIGTAAAASSARSLEDIALQTLTDRGQRHEVAWDAFKDERGWTVTLTWVAGHTENRAEWAFSAQPVGGTVTARNAAAADLLEPSRAPLRTVERLGGDQHDASEAAIPARPEPARPEPARLEPARLEPARFEATRSRSAESAQGAFFDARPTVGDGAGDARTDGATQPSTPDTPAATVPPRGTRRGQRPPMPSWEDVLLGTRAAEH